jgi:hypothetical protein
MVVRAGFRQHSPASPMTSPTEAGSGAASPPPGDSCVSAETICRLTANKVCGECVTTNTNTIISAADVWLFHVAARVLGASRRWRQIAALNGLTDLSPTRAGPMEVHLRVQFFRLVPVSDRQPSAFEHNRRLCSRVSS